MFVGRESELAELERRLASGRFEFGVVYGTRRIGKTTMLQEFIKGKNAFYFQARKADEKDNLAAFSREYRRFRGMDEHVRYEAFSDAFESIAADAKSERMVLIIDEVAYLCQKNKSLLSLLQFFVDGAFREAQLMLILSGSNVSFMEQILNNRNDPLYQRATFQIHLEKMPFHEARAFVDDRSAEEQIQYLGLFGPHPYYLGMIDHAVSFEENVRRLLYSKYGTLLDAPEKIMPVGVSEQNMYNSILQAVARGKRFSKEIAEAVGVENNYVAKYLSSLVQMQVLEKRESFIRNKKTNYYAVADSLLRFWYRFIFDQRDIIQNGFGEMLFREDLEGIRDFTARSFEDVALLWLEEQNREGKLPVYYGSIRNYSVENSRLGRSVELDGLAEGIGKQNNHLLAVECKYRKTPFSMAMLDHLRESLSLFSQYEVIDYYLISRSGFTENVRAIHDPHIHLVTLEEVLRPLTGKLDP
ncbi:MAG: ATP-binding protein [Clostridia bacterium]|nr:ATP-binding protein [Clostridia bacterium]